MTGTPCEIELLTGHAALAPLLGRWHHDEWGHLYDLDVWDLDDAVAEFEAMAAPGSTDLTWVAFDGSGRSGGDVLGSVSLVASDDLAGWEHVSPWLASLYVRPEARGRGVAGALVDALVEAARSLGHREVHLFTSGQEAYWAGRGWAVVATVDTEGHASTVMARSTSPHGARRAVSSQWCSTPAFGGAYTYLRVGASPDVRHRLRDEVLPGLWLAGEATSIDHPATMHGAWFEGERAALQVAASGASSALVIGAGLAGLRAAQVLGDEGLTVTVLEEQPHPGGRVATTDALGRPLPLGAAWLHGEIGHPLNDLVEWTDDDWTWPGVVHVAGHGRLDDDRVAAIDRWWGELEAEMVASDPALSVGEVLDRVLSSIDDPLVAAGVRVTMTAECESLYAAPMHDISARDGFESYSLPGDDRRVLAGLDAVVRDLAAASDVRCGHRVSALSYDDAARQWSTDTGLHADAVVVTVPVTAMHRLAVSPPLPGAVTDALGRIGAGPVAKVFVRFDAPWWPTQMPLRLAGTPVPTVIDVSEIAGAPTLCCFVVGDAARHVESLSERDLCRFVDDVVASVGLPPAD